MFDIKNINIRKTVGIFIVCLVLTVLIIIYIVPHIGNKQSPGGDGSPPIIRGSQYTIESPSGLLITAGTSITTVDETTTPTLTNLPTSKSSTWIVGADNSIVPVSAPTYQMYYKDTGEIVMGKLISPPFTISSVSGTKNGYYITRPDDSYVAPSSGDVGGTTLTLTKSPFIWNFIPVV
jgi:hypothetical protein